ncbi:MAG TPA: hypothetical protein VI462_09050 [Acidimicrobiia bacterium]
MTTISASVEFDPRAENFFGDPDDGYHRLRDAALWPRLEVDEVGLHRVRRAHVAGDATLPMHGVR